MTPDETKLSKFIGIPLAVVCLVVISIGKIVFLLWKLLCVPVIGAFAELGRDLKTIMKGEG